MTSDESQSPLFPKSPRAQNDPKKFFDFSSALPKPADNQPDTLIQWFLALPEWIRGWMRDSKRARLADASSPSSSSLASAIPVLSPSDADSHPIRGSEAAAEAIAQARGDKRRDPGATEDDPFVELRKWLIARIVKICNAQSAESVASSAIVSFLEKYVSETGSGEINNRKQAAWVLWRIARNKAIDRKRRRPSMVSINDSQFPIDPQAPTLTPLEECLVDELGTQITASRPLVAILGQHLEELDRRARELCGDGDDDQSRRRLKAFWMLFFRRQLRLRGRDIQESLEWDAETLNAFQTEIFQPLNREFRKQIRQELEDRNDDSE